MPRSERCPRCGSELPAGVSAESCPRCLLGLGLEMSTAPAPLEPPGRIGPYRLLSVLGEGGMGTVYLAEQEEPIRRQVALKVIKRGMDTREVIARFESERQALALMSHPGIAKVFDAGTTPDGLPYFVMEHVPGIPITEYCDRNRLSADERLRLFIEVCDAVQHAHQKGIIHRDLKPSNVLVTVEEANPRPKVIDFGVAKALRQRLTEKTLFTQRGVLVGTPGYMSPEQAEMADLDVDTRTDIYSLGALVYELLVGAVPFDPKRLREAGWAEMQRIIREEEPVKPSTRISNLGDTATTIADNRQTDPPTLRRELRGDLDWITLKALEKDRTRRYGTAAELAADIERHLRHEPVVASPPDPIYRLRKFVRRHRVPVIAASLTALGLMAATAISLQQMREARRQRDEAVYEKQRADSQVEFQSLMLDSVGSGRVTMREIVDQGRLLLEQEYAGQPRVAASIALALASQYLHLGERELQFEMLRRAESLALRGGAKDTHLLSRCHQAMNLQERNLAEQASALFDRIQPDLAAAPPLVAAECLQTQAEVEIKRANFDKAAALGRRAVDLMEKFGSTTGYQYLGMLNTWANALENAKRRREALQIYERIASAYDGSGRGNTMTRIIIRNNLGIALSNLGEMTAAEPVLQQTLEDYGRTNPAGDVHPAILINYCRTVLFLRKLDAAGTWYERLYRQAAERGDADMQENGAYGMVEVELLRGRLDEAARWTAEEKRANARLPEPRRANGPLLDGALAHARGDAAAARASYEEALRAMGYFEGKRDYGMRAVLIRAAEAELDGGAPARALEYARAAAGIATSDPLSETRSAYVGEARLLEGRALLARGDSAGARAALTRAVTALRSGAGAEHPRSREAEGSLAGAVSEDR
jgi:eukaryotic-like serine/threonine-protein kinase